MTLLQHDAQWFRLLESYAPQLISQLGQRWGLSLPPLKVQLAQKNHQRYQYSFYLNDTRIDQGEVYPNQALLPLNSPSLLPSAIKSQTTFHGSLVELHPLNAAPSNAKTPQEAFLAHLGKVLRRHAHEFIDIQQVRDRFRSLEQSHPEMVREAIPKMISWPRLTEVMQRLVEDQIMIRDMRTFLKILINIGPEGKDLATLCELLRHRLKKHIAAKAYDIVQHSTLYMIDSAFEEFLRQHLVKESGVYYLALPPEFVHNLERYLDSHSHIKRLGQSASLKQTLILTESDVRRPLQRLLDNMSFDTWILNLDEIDPSQHIQSIEYLSLDAVQKMDGQSQNRTHLPRQELKISGTNLE
jgi:type III secretion protein V